jgi:hypothetical protein
MNDKTDAILPGGPPLDRRHVLGVGVGALYPGRAGLNDSRLGGSLRVRLLPEPPMIK